MERFEIEATALSVRGARPSLIENFGIEGLYGYRSISLASNYAATILIAKNGTGKTTLLGALDAFLRLQFTRLRNVEFRRIHCKLRSIPEELVLTHDDVKEFLQIPTDGELERAARRASVDPTALFSYVVEEWPQEPGADPTDNKTYSSISSSNNYNYTETRSLFDRLKKEILARQPNVARVASAIESTLNDYDLVYLPTYRRIELALIDDGRLPPYRRRKRPKFNVAVGSLFTGNIQFGLSDITDRLSDLNQKIILESNNGYRKISANIINELIDGSFDAANLSESEIPTQDELKLFFARLEQGRRVAHYAPVSIPNLDRIYSDDSLPEPSSKFLKYFLWQLSTVINASKEIEAPVDAFVENCNKYLASQEPSTSVSSEPDSPAQTSGKILKLDRRNLRVHVETIPEGRKIPLDALSSGEKQMISLFAKLYLYPGNKVVLIDEPELSLSIDWQRQILADVLSAPLCEQVIAITHSPFVFDNELEPFAKSLTVSVEPLTIAEVFATHEDDDHE